MASSGSRTWKWVFGLLLLAVILGGSWVGYRSYMASAEQAYKAGEAAYAQGTQALEAKDTGAALQRLDEARIKAQVAFEAVEKTLKKTPETSAEAQKLKNLKGKIMWLRAQAQRDHAYARAMSEQQPFPVADDTTTGEKYRSFLVIPDFEEKREAVVFVREAASLLPADADIQKSALRTELTMQPMQWDFVESFAQNILKINPKDSRANYLLARYEFEQPQKRGDTRFEPTPVEKRVPSRITKAREYLAKSKESGKFPLWRTLHLEAMLHRWFAENAMKLKKPAEQEKEEQALRVLLFDKQSGALRRAKDGEDMSQMSMWDAQGLFGLHLLALDMALQDRKKPAAAEPGRVLETMNALMALCQKLSEDSARLSEAAETAVLAAKRIEPVWAEKPTVEAQAQLAAVTALVIKAKERKIARLSLYAELGRVLWRQAYLERKRGAADWQSLEKDGRQLVDDGIKLAQEAKITSADLTELHILAAEMKLARGAKRDELAPHLEAVRKTTGADARTASAMASLLEGTLAEREGRLELARENLEKVLASNQPDLILRSFLPLSGIYMVLNQPDKAVFALENIDRAFAGFEQLPTLEKAWIMEFVQNPAQVSGLLAVAHLEAAKAKFAKQIQTRPTGPVEYALIRNHEEAVQRVLRKVTAPDPVNLYVRLAQAAYLSATRRADKAAEEVAALQKDYPDSLDALKLTIVLKAQKGVTTADGVNKKPGLDDKTRGEVDQQLQEFIAKYPGNRHAKLHWAEWLTRTQRGAEAVAYLKDPNNFRADKDELFNRLLALALIAKGDRDEALKVLQYLPDNPTNDLLLIQFAASQEDQTKRLGNAISRYENNGPFRCLNARLAFNAGKPAEAAEGYFQALDVTRVKPLAQEGLQRSLLVLAQTNPSKARELITQMLKSKPEEPALLLPLAYAHMLMDEVGRPADTYDRVKTMGAALNLWERAMQRNTAVERVAAPLTKALYWVLVNQPEAARNEVLRALQLDDKHVGALALLASLDLDLQTPELLAEARKTLVTLKAVQPDHPQVALLTAMADERAGNDAAAMEGLEQALLKDPKQPTAWTRLLGLAEKKGDKNQALAFAKKWRQQQPDEALALENEIRLLAANGVLAEARKGADVYLTQAAKKADEQKALKPPLGVDGATWQKQQQAKADNIMVNAQLDVARAFSRAGAWDDAEVWIKRVLDKHPDLEAALAQRGDIFVRRKMWSQARATYEQVLKRNPRHLVAGNNLAAILADQAKDYSQAYDVAQRVRKGRFSQQPVPGDRLDPAFLDTLGTIYRACGKPELFAEMRDLFETARKRYPLDPRMCLYLGDAFAGLRQPERAEEMFATAVTLAAPDVKNGLAPESRKDVIQKVEESRKKLKVPTALPR